MPRYQQGQVLENDKGERVQLRGSEWVPVASAQDEARQQAHTHLAKETGPLEAGLVAAGRALGGGWLYGDGGGAYEALQRERPISTLVGGAAPAVLTAIATGGASAPLSAGWRTAIAAGTEAGMGALGDPESPFSSAAIGGGLGLAGAALPGAVRSARDLTASLPSMGELGQRAAQVAQAVPFPQKVQASILRIAGEGGEGAAGRPGPVARGARAGSEAREPGFGYYTAQEAQDRGLMLTPGDTLDLDALTPEARAFAHGVRQAEALRATSDLIGGPISMTRSSQKQWITDRIASELGLAPGTALTPDVLGAQFQKVGQVFDDVSEQLGNVPISNSALGGLEDLVLDARTGYQARIGRIHASVEDALNKNNGVLSFEDWQHTKNQLDRAIGSATRQGDTSALADFTEYRERLQDAMLDHAAPGVREGLVEARHQYRLLKLLTQRVGTVDPQGAVNVSTLRTNLGSTPARFKSAQADDLTRAIDTVHRLQALLVPSSGTAERLLFNMANNAPQAGLGALGAAGVMGLGSMLFGG